MKASKWIKLVCFVLIIALSTNVLLPPISTAYAQGIIQGEQNTNNLENAYAAAQGEQNLNSISNAQKANERAESVSTDNEKYTELTDKRTEYLKYYQLESKNYEAVSFGLPVQKLIFILLLIEKIVLH